MPQAPEVTIARPTRGGPPIADKLPLGEPRQRYRAARDRHDDLRRAFDGLRGKLDPARIAPPPFERGRADKRKAWPNARDDDRLFADVDRRIADEKAKCDHLRARREAMAGEMKPLAERLQRADAYLASVQNKSLLTPVEPAAPGPGDTVDQLREKGEQLRADIGATAAAPWPLALLRPLAMKEIDQLAVAGRVNVYQLVETGRAGLGWPRVPLNVAGGAGDNFVMAHGETHDALSLMCWALRDVLKKAIDAELKAATAETESGALDADQRAAKIAQLSDELLKTERLEIACCERDRIQLRGDLDPRAWLQIVGPQPEQR